MLREFKCSRGIRSLVILLQALTGDISLPSLGFWPLLSLRRSFFYWIITLGSLTMLLPWISPLSFTDCLCVPGLPSPFLLWPFTLVSMLNNFRGTYNVLPWGLMLLMFTATLVLRAFWLDSIKSYWFKFWIVVVFKFFCTYFCWGELRLEFWGSKVTFWSCNFFFCICWNCALLVRGLKGLV